MASYRKRGGMWRAEVVRAGQRQSRSFLTRAQARAWADALEESIAGGIRVRHETLADAIRAYLDEVAPTHAGERWERLRLDRFGREYPALVGLPLSQVRAGHLTQWKQARLNQVQAGSVLREMNLLQSVLEHARKEKHWIAANPFADVARPRAPRSRKRRVSEDEAMRIGFALGYSHGMATTLSQRVAVMFWFAIETGMRAGEMVALPWECVHPRHVHISKSKNGDERDVPLSIRARELLACLPRGAETVFAVDNQSRDALFRKARNRAQISGLCFHDSRHEACTRLARKLPILDLARMIGHRDIRSLMVYYNPTAEEMADQLDAAG